jgi:hypothetical protein
MGCTLEYAKSANTNTHNEAVNVTTCMRLPNRSNPSPMIGVKTIGMT